MNDEYSHCMSCGQQVLTNHNCPATKPTSVSPSTEVNVYRPSECYVVASGDAPAFVALSAYTSLAAQLEKVKQERDEIVKTINLLPSVTGLSPIQNPTLQNIRLAILDLQSSYGDAARSRNGQHTKALARAESAEQSLVATREALEKISLADCNCHSNSDPEWHSPRCLKNIAEQALNRLGDKGDTK